MSKYSDTFFNEEGRERGLSSISIIHSYHQISEEIMISIKQPEGTTKSADYNFANLVPAVATVKGDRLGDCISVNRSQSYVNSNANANYSNQQ